MQQSTFVCVLAAGPLRHLLAELDRRGAVDDPLGGATADDVTVLQSDTPLESWMRFTIAWVSSSLGAS